MQREITRELVRRLLPGRMAESNKGSYGSVLAAAGSMALCLSVWPGPGCSGDRRPGCGAVPRSCLRDWPRNGA